MNDAGKAQGRFCFSADNGHGNAGGEAYSFQEGCAVHRIPDSGGGYSQYFLHLLHGNDMGIYGKTFQRPLLCFFRELPGIQRHAFGETDGFLFLVHQFVGTVGSNLHDNKADGVGTQVDDCYSFHGISFCRQPVRMQGKDSACL